MFQKENQTSFNTMNNMTSEIVLYHNENLTQSTLSQTSNYDNDRQGTIYRQSVPKKLLPLENENMNNIDNEKTIHFKRYWN